MMNSNRSDGRRLLLVIALIGILSTYGTSAQNVLVTNSDDATTEESLDSTVAGAQSTAEGADTSEAQEVTAEGAVTSETQEVTTVASAGETATSLGEILPGGTSDGQTGNTVGESSIAEGRTVETATSTGEFSTAGRVSGQVRTGDGEAGVESSTGGTEGQTTATFTGATSTDGPRGTVRQEETTGATTTEESLTTSVKQAAGCNSTDICETCEPLRVDNRLTLNGSICKAEAEFQYCVNIALHDDRNPDRQRSHTSGSSHKVICSAVLNPLKEEVSKLRNKIRSRPRPTTSTTRSPPPPERKRRQANEATTSEPLDQLDWDDSDIDELWNATRIVVDKVAGGSGENMLTSESLTTSVKQTTATSTGATSTDGAGDGPLGAVQQEETTGATTTEESLTTSVRQTAGYNSTVTCEDCGTLRVNNRLYYTGSICKAEAGFQYNVTIALHDKRNPSVKRSYTRGSSDEVNCSTVFIPIKEEVRILRNKISNRPTTPRPTTSTVDPNPPAERKRRQANEATTSDPLDDFELDDSDIDELWGATIRVIDKVAGGSGENSSQALQSSPQSTQSLVESSVASATTSTVLASTSAVKDDSAKVEDPKRLEERTQPASKNVWVDHRGIFVTVLIIISVCVVVTGFCCLVMKCRERGQNRNSEKQPIAMEEAREAHPSSASNPIPDHEMIQDEAPMQERENPAVTPNGGGQHISKADEDNGWVVPLDELSNAEKEKPEVENTRL